MACCPTCGHELVDHGIRIHAEAGIIVAGGRFVQVPRREMQIFEMLWNRPGRWFSQAQLFEEVYRREDEPEGEEVIQSHISKLRKRLRSIGLDVRSERFRGYCVNPRVTT